MESGSYFYPGIYKLTPPMPGTSFVTGTVTVCLEADSQPIGPSSPTVPSAGTVVSFGDAAQPIYGDVNITNSALSVTGSVGVVGTPNVSIVGKPTVTGSVGIVGTTIVSVSGTSAVTVAGTPAISGTVNIAGTPTVSVVGTPTVAVTNIPSVSIIGTPAISGSVSITGIPNVTVAGTSAISGTVNIVGTPTVSVVGTPTVAVTNIPSVSITGTPTVSVTDGTKSTYSAAVVGLAATTTNPTDIFTIYGSATKIIRILRIGVTAVQTTAGQRDVLLIRRSRTNTAGISTVVSAVSHDFNNGAATATIVSYTGNPTTLGTIVGTLYCRRLQVNTSDAASPVDFVNLYYGNRPSQAIVLRGVNDGLAVNLNGVVSAGNLWDICCEWTEE